jgi:hypothetical protein
MKISDEQYRDIISGSEDMWINALWSNSSTYYYDPNDPPLPKISFAEHVDRFFEVLERLLRSTDGQLIDEATHLVVQEPYEPHLERFRQAIPSDGEHEGLRDGLWFFLPHCPYSLFWRRHMTLGGPVENRWEDVLRFRAERKIQNMKR